jgi:acyl-homoserine-lactone acylase
VRNPGTGWIQNTNNWPYSAAGPNSPSPDAFPATWTRFGENARGVHAVQLLGERRGWTLDSLVTAAYDSHQPAFAQLVPTLIAAYDAAPRTSPLKRRLAEPIAALRGWDHRWGVDSVPTSPRRLLGRSPVRNAPGEVRARGNQVPAYMATQTSADQKLRAFAAAVDRLERDFGSWRTPWGRSTASSASRPPSITRSAMPRPASRRLHLRRLGLARLVRREPAGRLQALLRPARQQLRRRRRVRPRLRARAVSAGGQSGDPRSPHFNDQAERYATGKLREVYFHPDQLKTHTKRVYRPGL